MTTNRRVAGTNRTITPSAVPSAAGRSVGFDAEDYKNRNVVERAFNKLKNWRGLATRYDKHALIYRRGMVLASIVLWLTA